MSFLSNLSSTRTFKLPLGDGATKDFTIDEVDGLSEYICDLEDQAFDEGKEEVEESVYQEGVNNDFVRALSAAISAGDIAEAEFQLTKLAVEIGAGAEDAVDQGRFDPKAREYRRKNAG